MKTSALKDLISNSTTSLSQQIDLEILEVKK